MKCVKCNYENIDTSKFCANCGTDLKEQVSKIKKENKSKLIAGIILFIIGVAITLLTFFYFGPFLGLLYLIPGIILTMSTLLDIKNKWLKILLIVIITLIVIFLVCFIGFLIWNK